MLIRPQLFLNGRTEKLVLIENTKVTIETVTVDDVTNTVELKNVSFKEGTDVVAKFMVPPKLHKITVKVEGQAQPIHKNKDSKFT